MKYIKILSCAALMTGASFGSAFAGCGIESGRISILANDFPALHAVVSKAEECAGGAVTFAKNHTAKHQELQGPALTANPAEYTAKIVTNGSIVPLLTEGLLRPLDDLVAKHGQSLGKNQLITIDGKIMAVAFMANAQHLVVDKIYWIKLESLFQQRMKMSWRQLKQFVQQV